MKVVMLAAPSPTGSSHLARRALLLWLIVIGVITLWPSTLPNGGPDSLARTLLNWAYGYGLPRIIDVPVVEFTANIALFVPLGWAAYHALPRLWMALLLGPLVTVLVESAQALFLPARVPDVRDLIANTGGALLGVALATLVHRYRRRKDRSR